MFPVDDTEHVVVIVYDNVVVPEVDMKKGKGTLISGSNLGGKFPNLWREIDNLRHDFFIPVPPNLLHPFHCLRKLR